MVLDIFLAFFCEREIVAHSKTDGFKNVSDLFQVIDVCTEGAKIRPVFTGLLILKWDMERTAYILVIFIDTL